MHYQYPHTIDNGSGEQLTFQRLVTTEEGAYLEVENYVLPNSGPPMHVHFKQEEGLTVVKGKVGVEVLGHEAEYYGPGETKIFKAGTPHRFWNAGNEPLVCKGYIKPADNIEFFLTEIYKSTASNGGKEPYAFDAAYLLHRYRSEFELMEIPSFVKKVIFPITRLVGKLQGKHKKYKDAPAPVESRQNV